MNLMPRLDDHKLLSRIKCILSISLLYIIKKEAKYSLQFINAFPNRVNQEA